MDLQALKLLLAPPAWGLYRRTLGVAAYRPESGLPAQAIFACLHRDILPALIHVRPARPCLLVSSSPDGDILVRSLGSRDYAWERGSTGADGSRGFQGLLRRLKQGECVGLAVDGPNGPFGRVQEGVLHLARLSGVPILALRAEARRGIHLGTWDRTLLPLPFTPIRMVAAPPLAVPREAGPRHLADLRIELEAFFAAEGAGKPW